MAVPFANPQQQYLKTQIETASKPQLLLLIFDTAVKKLHIAKKAMRQKEIEKAHVELTKVQKIFMELMCALDFELGGDLAHQLVRIYDFVYHQLVQANIKQNPDLIEQVIPIVDNLRQGWTQAVDKFLAEQAASTAAGTNPSAPAPPPAQPKAPACTQNPPSPAVQPTQPRFRLNVRG